MTTERMFTEKTPSAKGVAKVLEEAGVKFVFGMSGGYTDALIKAMDGRKDAIRTIIIRHESLAGIMAEVYGRLTGKPGVLIAQAPWALGFGIAGILEARLSSTPMIVLTDFTDLGYFALHAPYQSGLGNYGTWDAVQSFKGVSKEVFQAREPSELVHGTQLAIKHALSGQRGPVTVIFTAKAAYGNVGPDSQPTLYPTKNYLPSPPPPEDSERIAVAAKVLAAAKNPVIMAGNGVRISNAFDALRDFAAAAQIPVVTSPTGKGVIADTDLLALGVCGNFGTPAANACVGDADVVLVVGSKLTAGDTIGENPALLDPRRQTFIQIDIEPRNAAWTFPADQVLIGDAGRVLTQLRHALPKPADAESGVKRVQAYRKTHGHFDAAEYLADRDTILPQRIVGELMRSLPEDVMIAVDAGENRIFMTHWYKTRRAGHFVMAGGSGAMGYAIPAAMATKLVHPERPVVAVCGDGGFGMTMNGLLTALHYDIPIVVVIFNNSVLGWVRHGGGVAGSDLGDFDYAAIARSMGCEGIRVDDSRKLGDALSMALAAGKPTVIDVKTAKDQTFATVESPLLHNVAGKAI